MENRDDLASQLAKKAIHNNYMLGLQQAIAKFGEGSLTGQEITDKVYEPNEIRDISRKDLSGLNLDHLDLMANETHREKDRYPEKPAMYKNSKFAEQEMYARMENSGDFPTAWTQERRDAHTLHREKKQTNEQKVAQQKEAAMRVLGSTKFDNNNKAHWDAAYKDDVFLKHLKNKETIGSTSGGKNPVAKPPLAAPNKEKVVPPTTKNKNSPKNSTPILKLDKEQLQNRPNPNKSKYHQ